MFVKVLERSDPAVFRTVLHDYLKVPNPFFLQVGAFDGISEDPLFPLIENFLLKGILIEPQKIPFQILQNNYLKYGPGFHFVNAAIDEFNGERELYRLKPTEGMLNPVASFDMKVVEQHIRESGLGMDKVIIERELIQCVSFDSLLRWYGNPRIDILQVDAEGADERIVKWFDIPRRLPTVVQFEHKNVGKQEYTDVVDILMGEGYSVILNGWNTVAYK